MGPDTKTLREEGNGFFKEGKYAEAVECYMRALRTKPEQTELSTLYKNQAMCLIRLGKYAEAEVACSSALEIAENDPKALYRRSLAYEKQEKYEKAYNDAVALMKTDPKNKEGQALLTRLNPIVQERVREQQSTSSKTKQMFEVALDTTVEREKRLTALQNLMVLAKEESGRDMLVKAGAVNKMLHVCNSETDIMLRAEALRVLGSLAKKSRARALTILNTMTLKRLLILFTLEKEEIGRAAGHLLQMVFVSVTNLEDIRSDRDAHEDRRKKHPESRLKPWIYTFDVIDEEVLPTAYEIMVALFDVVTHRKVTRHGRDQALEFLIKYVTRRDGVGYTMRAVESGGLEAVLQVAGTVPEHKTLDVTNNTLMHCSLLLQKLYDDLVQDKEREKYRGVVDSYFNEMLADTLLESKVECMMSLAALLQGPFDVGNSVLSRAGILEMILALADSESERYTKYAIEALVHATSKKERCSGVIMQATPILKKLYQSPNNAVRVRALVGLCKLGSFGGSDAGAKTFADGSTPTLAKACRKMLCGETDVDVYKWAVEGLAYLTLDAEVKTDLVKDTKTLQAIFKLSQLKDKVSAVYPVSQVLVNLTNSYDKKNIDPELLELAKFAKHHVPEEHEMDNAEWTNYRIDTLVNEGMIPAITLLSDCESKNARELLARVFNAVCENAKHRGKVLACGGAKVLIPLALDNSEVGKVLASQALARIAITNNPDIAFTGQRRYEVVRPLHQLLDVNCTALQNYEGMLALTNLASLEDSVKKRIKDDGVVSLIDHYMYEEHAKLRTAAVECLCNLVSYEEIGKMFKGANERVKLMVLYCGEGDDEEEEEEQKEGEELPAVEEAPQTREELAEEFMKDQGKKEPIKSHETDGAPSDTDRLVMAAAGILAIISRDREVAHKIMTATTQWVDIMTKLCVSENLGRVLRAAHILRNIVLADEEAAKMVAQTALLEVMMALTRVEVQKPVQADIKGVLEEALGELVKWGVIEPNTQARLT